MPQFLRLYSGSHIVEFISAESRDLRNTKQNVSLCKNPMQKNSQNSKCTKWSRAAKANTTVKGLLEGNDYVYTFPRGFVLRTKISVTST